MPRKLLRALTVAALVLCGGVASAQTVKLRVATNPQIYSFLPLFVAVDKGFFAEEKLDIEITAYGGSALSLLPQLARGDLDFSTMVAGPGFFNQYSQGFSIKLIASVAHSKEGWHDGMWVLVRKDMWDSGAIRTYADLKGKVIEGGPKGSPIYLTSTQAVIQGGLTLKDVTITERLRTVPDAIPLFRNKAIDVLTMVEPMASRLEAEGLAVRWKASYEVIPWFQESFLAAAPKFLTERRDVTKRFLRAFLRGAQTVDKSGGKWTPELLQIVAKWSKMSEDVLKQIGGPQHVGQMGRIDLASIERQQELWRAEGMVTTKVPVADLVDTTIVEEVRAEMGIK